MERLLQLTEDGSHTISIPDWKVTYHSKHGAVQESMHIFIGAGLKYLQANQSKELTILEIGFGTGLNALLTFIESGDTTIYYESLEAYPLNQDTARQLNYCSQLGKNDLESAFDLLHQSAWNQEIQLAGNFTLLKQQADALSFETSKKYDLIYFDAFAPEVQPELWTTEIFTRLYKCTKEGGILLTYCSKSSVRKNMESAGFTVQKIPGPKGKREIVRAIKPKILKP